MQHERSITDRPPKPIGLPPRKQLRELRDEALQVSGVVQAVICSAAVGAALGAIILRANAVGMAFGILLMGLAAANALLVQSALCTGSLSALYLLSRTMVRSRNRVVWAAGSVLRKVCAALPLWAGGTDTVQRIRMATPYRLEARHARASVVSGDNIETVHVTTESKRGDNLSPIAAMHVALGTSPHAVAARRRIEVESRRSEASANPTEDDELWIAAGAMLRVVFSLGMTEERLASLQASIARWMSGIISGWTPDRDVDRISLSPDDAWRFERFSSTSLAFIAVAGNHGANAGKADLAIHLLYHRAMGYAGAPIFEFISAPDTQPPNAIVHGCYQEVQTPTSPPLTMLTDMQPWAEPPP